MKGTRGEGVRGRGEGEKRAEGKGEEEEGAKKRWFFPQNKL